MGQQNNNLKDTMLVKAISPAIDEWVTGYYTNWCGKDAIVAAYEGNSDRFIDGCTYIPNPDTFCRFTGIYCAETKKPIFEGDNVKGNFFVRDTFGTLHWDQCSLFAKVGNSSICAEIKFHKLDDYAFTLTGGNIHDPKPNDKDF